MENQHSTWLSQEACVGVKWKAKRGCSASHTFTSGLLWYPALILHFAQALERAAAKASELALGLAELQEKWRNRAGRPRRHSSAEALIVELPAHPIVTVATAQKFLGRSKQAVNEAIATLADKGVLHPITLGKRNRAWEARESFELVNGVERELATTTDDDQPTRPSPRVRASQRRR